MDRGEQKHRRHVAYFQRGKLALFRAFFETKKRNPCLGSLTFLTMGGIQGLQMLYLAFPGGESWWPEKMTTIARTLLEQLFLDFAHDAPGFEMALLGFAAAISWAALAGMVAIALNPDGNAWIGWWNARIVRFSHTVLLIPVLGVLLRAYQSFSTVIQIVGLSSIPVFLLSSFFGTLFLIPQIPFQRRSSKDRRWKFQPYSAPHGRVESLSILIRSIAFIFVRSVDGGDHLMQVARLIASNVAGAGLVALYLHFLPFHVPEWNIWQAACFSLGLWASISEILSYLLKDRSDMGSMTVFWGGLPFFVVSVILFGKRRLNSLRKRDERLFLGPFLTEARFRLIHEIYKASINPTSITLLEGTEKALRFAIEQHPRSGFLNLYVASVIMLEEKKIVYALNRIKTAKSAGLSIDFEFFLFCLNKENQERNRNTAGANSFMEFDKNLHQVKNHLLRTIKHLDELWGIIQRGCSITILIDSARRVRKSHELCNDFLKNLLKSSNGNVEALQVKAMVTAFLENDLIRARSILGQQQQQGTADSDVESRGFAVCIVNANEKALGEIQEVTEALVNLFGYKKKSDLIGRNVRCLCPAPFDRVHDDFMRHFLLEDTEFQTKTRNIWGLHKEGYIIPVNFVITPSTNVESELILIGKFEERQLPPGTYLLLVDAFTHAVTGGTRSAADAFKLDVTSMRKRIIKIEDIVPNFFKSSHETRYREQKDFRVNRRVFSMKATRLEFKSRPESEVSFESAIFLVFFKEKLVNGAMMIPMIATLKKQANFAKKLESKDRNMWAERVHQVADTEDNAANSVSNALAGDVQQSTKRRVALFREHIMKKLRNPDPVISRYSVWGSRFDLLLSLVASGSTVGLVLLYSQFLQSFEQLEDLYTQAFRLSLLATSLLLDLQHSLDGMKNLIRESATELRELHGSIVEALGTSTENIRQLLFQPSLSLDFDSNNVSFHISVVEHVNFAEGYLENAGCVDHGCSFILQNAHAAPIQAALAIARSYEAQTKQALELLDVVNSIVGVLLIVIMMMALIYGYVPAALHQSRRKARMRLAFTTIPASICEDMQFIMRQRIKFIETNQPFTLDVLAEGNDDSVTKGSSGKGFNYSMRLNAGVSSRRASKGSSWAQKMSSFKKSSKTSSGMVTEQLQTRKIAQSTPAMISSELVNVNTLQSSQRSMVFPETGGAADADDDIHHRTFSPEANAIQALREARAKKRTSTVEQKMEDESEPFFAERDRFSNVDHKSFLLAVVAALKTSTTFCCLLIYFTVTFVLDHFHHQDMVANLHEIKLTGAKFVFAHVLIWWMSNPRSNTTLAKVESTRIALEQVENDFLYGESNPNLNGFSATAGDAFDLYFNNACDDSCLENIANIEDEKSFEFASRLSHGLILAFEDFLKLALLAEGQGLKDPRALLEIGAQLRKGLHMKVEEVEIQIYQIRTEKVFACLLLAVSIMVAQHLSRRNFRKMERDVQDLRILMIGLPLELYDKAPQLLQLLQNEAQI